MLKFFLIWIRATGIQLSPKYGNVRMRDIMYVSTYVQGAGHTHFFNVAHVARARMYPAVPIKELTLLVNTAIIGSCDCISKHGFDWSA